MAEQAHDQVMENLRKFETEFSSPYLSQISELENRNNVLESELNDVKSKLDRFEHLLPLLEREEETFQLQIKETSLIQKAVMVIDQYRLYPKLQRDYLEYKRNGGKRPKDPVRQFFQDVIKTVLLRPSIITGLIKSQGNYDMREGPNNVT